MSADIYTGPVCYQDGWHWSTRVDANGDEQPDQKLYLNDDGSYRIAAAGDQSWQDRKHGRHVQIVMEGQPDAAVTVNPEEMQAIQKLLDERRSGQ